MDTEPHDPTLQQTTSALPPLEDERRPHSPIRWAAACVTALVLAVGVVSITNRDDHLDGDLASEGLPDEGVAGTADSATDDAPGGASDASTSDEASREDAMLDYAECMRDNGVDMHDPVGGDTGGAVLSPGGPGGVPGGPGGEKFAAAQEACQPILDEAGLTREPPSAEQQAEQQDRLLQVAQCMRDRGHDFEDPEPNQGGMGFAPDSDSSSDSFRTDLDECSREAGLRGADDRDEGDS